MKDRLGQGLARWFIFIVSASGCFKEAIDCERSDNGLCIDRSDTATPDSDAGTTTGVPTGVVATTERVGDIELSWDAVPGAAGYRVFRCDAACEGPAASWKDLTRMPIAAGTRFVDDSALRTGS